MSEAGLVWSPEQIDRWRDRRYRRQANLRLRSLPQALDFVNDVGFCLLFPARGVELPTFWEAICGEARPLPRRHHNDPELHSLWRWKDELPAQGLAFYGKLLRKRPTLISLELLRYFYALSENYGDLYDYLLEYEDGKLSEEARRVYEALLEHGAQPTSHLRRQAGLAGKANAVRFDRAILELQLGFKIAKTGISDANAWRYCYVYDLLLRRWPELPSRAAAIGTTEAMRTVLLAYLRNVGVARLQDVSRLFGWEASRIDTLCDSMARDGWLWRGVKVEGWSDQYLAHASLAHGDEQASSRCP